jgi:hypothetical protein
MARVWGLGNTENYGKVIHFVKYTSPYIWTFQNQIKIIKLNKDKESLNNNYLFYINYIFNYSNLYIRIYIFNKFDNFPEIFITI